jgi:hypothetical protein
MMVGLIAGCAKLRNRPAVMDELPRPMRILAAGGHPRVVRDELVRFKADDLEYPTQVPCGTFTARGGKRG